MALRLMPSSPRRRIRLASVATGLMADRSGWIEFATGSLTPATGAGTTRFCRTLQRRSSCAPLSLTVKPPCNQSCARDAAASIATCPNVRDDGQRPSLRDRMAGVVLLIWGNGEADYFCARGWTGQITLKLLCKIARARTPQSPPAAPMTSSQTSTARTGRTRRWDTDRSASSKPRSRKTKHHRATWQLHCHRNYRVYYGVQSSTVQHGHRNSNKAL